MRKNKTPVQSYENFCKAFAGVFKKHAYRTGTYHTCYIRSAIDTYCWSEAARRRYIMEDACSEDVCGYRIARALILQGWDEDTIVDYSQQQQHYVDEAEDWGFLEVLSAAGYTNSAGFVRQSNGLRYEWLMDGAPDLSEYIEELDAEDDDDVDE